MADDDMLARRGTRLRILFVTSDKFPPFRPAAKAIFAEGIPAAGHDVDWLIQAADSSTKGGAHICGRGVAFVAPTNEESGRLARLKKHWADFRNDLTIFRLLRDHEYSLVQIKDKYLGAIVAIVAAKMHRLPVFFWLAYPHGEASSYAASRGVARYALFYALRGRLQRWLLYRIILPACDHVFVQSEQMRKDIAAEGIPASKMTPVPSSVNLAAIDAVAGSGPPRPNTVVYLGTLLRERQLDILIRAIGLVRTRIPEAELLFVGRGENPEDEKLLRAEAERLGLANAVTITGWLPMQIAWELVRAAGVCVSPYYPTAILRSTSPTKLVEYMALGKAVVANVHPEQSDVVERSGCGLLCGWSDAEFADAITSVLSNPSTATAMGTAGRHFVQSQRTHSVMTDLVIRTYREVLRSRLISSGTQGPSLRYLFERRPLSRRSKGAPTDD